VELVSLQFVAFLVVALAVYYAVGKLAPTHQWRVLLASSFAFLFMAGGASALFFVILVALITWAGALLVTSIDAKGAAARKDTKDRDEKKKVRALWQRRKRIAFWSFLVLAFAILFYFKYWNVVLYYLRIAPTFNSLGIVLPLGLSFYLFQSVAYLIDCYNQKADPERNFLRYLTFVSWFPQMIQGPINRFAHTAPQLLATHHLDAAGFERGLLRMGLGIIKKVAIANVLANVVTCVFQTAAGPDIPGSLALFGVLVYSIQMYGDFSGGIDIVEGASELFGIEMAPNFAQPYFSSSLAEFWRRWHMSLGAWMRDYVFYPLAVTKASKRLGKWAKAHGGTHAKHLGRTIPACVANILVFLFVGLWHGAEAHYVVWGLYNGVVVALSDLLAPTFDRMVTACHIRRESRGFRLFALLRTFAVVCVGRFFDCFAHVGDALSALAHVFNPTTYAPLAESLARYGATHATSYGFPLPTLVACIVVFAIDVTYESGRDVRGDVAALRPVPKALIICALTILVAASASLDTTQGGGGFLYANF
jgi:D-alanyl-lipoteichoic acid acyltransferase DltB (MBOAT superfamily)